MTALTDRLNAIRERRDTAFRFPTSASKQAASATDVLPLLGAVEEIREYIIEYSDIEVDGDEFYAGLLRALVSVDEILIKHLGGGDDER